MTAYDFGAHCVYYHRYHVVWATKYRYKVLTGDIRERARKIIRQSCDELGVTIVKGVLARDHVHMFLSVPPKHAISDVMRRIKGRSSRRLQQEFPELKRRYLGRHFWARGYFCSTSGNIVNALRSHLYEFGYIAPVGLQHLPKLVAVLEDETSDLPGPARIACRGILRQIESLGGEIAALDAQIAELSKESRWARLLQTMPGVGPITAMAIEAFAPPMETFRRGRDFAAWLGLVPRQSSSGGKARLGKVSKAGQHDIRRLLVIGAMAAMVGACRRGIPEDTWLGKLMLRKPRILVAIALANKMARRIWAMLTKGESYRDPALAAV